MHKLTPFLCLALLAGCASGGTPSQQSAAPAASAAQGEPGLRAVMAAICARAPIPPEKRDVFVPLLGVPEDEVPVEWCRRLDRAIVEGKVSGAQLAKLMSGDTSEAGKLALALLTSNEPAVSPAVQPSRRSQPDPHALADVESAERFFEVAVALAREYDARALDFYADDARMTLYRRVPEGMRKVTALTGAEFKALVPKIWPIARQRGERDSFSNIRVSIAGGRATIRGDRYSEFRCYTDKDWFMVIERQVGGSYLIVEEQAVIQPEASCTRT